MMKNKNENHNKGPVINGYICEQPRFGLWTSVQILMVPSGQKKPEQKEDHQGTPHDDINDAFAVKQKIVQGVKRIHSPESFIL
jgi:hypothetical protein